MARGVVRVGVIGTGFARATQLPVLRALPGVEIAIIASGKRENAVRAAAEHGIPRAAASWEEVTGDPSLDLVVISTPPFLHHPMALAAIRNRKHVLC